MDSGRFSDGSDGGAGEEYRPVNPIKGKPRGDGTADMVRLTWQDGKLVKVAAVEIWTPDIPKTSFFPKLAEKQGQADEVVVNYKFGQLEGDRMIKEAGRTLKYDRLHLIDQATKFNKTYEGLVGSGVVGRSPQLPASPPGGTVRSPSVGTRIGNGLMKGGNALGLGILLWDFIEAATTDDPNYECRFPGAECGTGLPS